MKISSLVAAVASAICLSIVGTRAGTLDITSGPSFSPSNVFTNNSIAAEVEDLAGNSGQVLRFTGSSDVAPNSSPAPTISVNGKYTATGTDIASVAYNFTVDLTSPSPVTLTIAGQVTGTLFGTQNFSASIVLTPGTQQYSGTFAAPFPFVVTSAGDFSATLTFDFNNATTTLSKSSAADAAQGLNIDIQQLDFQLSPEAVQVIPEPSSLAFLGVGIGALVLVGLRRRFRSATR